MTKTEAYDLFRALIQGRRVSIAAALKFEEELEKSGKDIIGQMPFLCFDFVSKQFAGDDLIFSFALVYLYKTMHNTEAGVIAYDTEESNMKNWKYAMVYKDDGGYLQFSMPTSAIDAGYVGHFFQMTKNTFRDEVSFAKGRAYYLDPYGKKGNEHFFDGKAIKEVSFSL